MNPSLHDFGLIHRRTFCHRQFCSRNLKKVASVEQQFAIEIATAISFTRNQEACAENLVQTECLHRVGTLRTVFRTVCVFVVSGLS